MPAPLKIRLTPQEDEQLLALKSDTNVPKRTRDRAEAITLNFRGWNVNQISSYIKYSPNTIRKIFYRWITRGIEGLYDAPRTGRKPRWSEEDVNYIESSLEKEPRTYNSYQLVEKLKKERSVSLSRERIRKILKKKIGDGKGLNIR
ncbi:helix-turn-helix domain-containing protein [Gloeothece verrucosa]|uniref:helix-turn-helix domain-containing protein n=1 Tax=Gloeothece verrucosa TaxID=2546359 RepID=UPI00031A42F5|nr:helix-turn-helix domain-containing protein [Gloeothece verrucosa]